MTNDYFYPMPDFLRLIRLPNLLIMAFTQYMVRWFLLFPMIDLKRSDLGYSLLSVQMTEQDFFLLVLSTMMIGAAGYIINDYFDVRIDEVNRPATNVVGKTIRRRVAMVAHMALNIIGVGIGLWLSWKYGMLRAGAILYITVPALLWFYSTNLKRQFLIGNLVIAFLSALVPLVVVLFEIPAIYRAFPDLVRGGYLVLTDVLNITLGIAAFAFVVSLLREIIKDTEDYEGDLAYGCKTLPIVLGIAPAKYVMTGLIFIVIGVLGWLQFLQLQAEDWLSFSWFMLLLQLPFVYLAFRIFTATRKSDWRFSSLLLKLIMIAGISYLFVYEHEIRQLIES